MALLRFEYGFACFAFGSLKELLGVRDAISNTVSRATVVSIGKESTVARTVVCYTVDLPTLILAGEVSGHIAHRQ
jgi:hypothetical protein